MYTDFKKLKVIKNLQKDEVILKPDKENGAVLTNNVDRLLPVIRALIY